MKHPVFLFVFVASLAQAGPQVSPNLEAMLLHLTAPVKGGSCTLDDVTSPQGCKAITEDFCQNTFSDVNQGNLDDMIGEEKIHIRLGSNIHHISYAEIGYIQAQENAVKRYQESRGVGENMIPKELFDEIIAFDKENPKDPPFVELADKLIHFPEIGPMIIGDSEYRKNAALSTQFNSYSKVVTARFSLALKKGAADRVHSKLPHYDMKDPSKNSEADTAIADKLSDDFLSEAYQGIWATDPKFLAAKKQFEDTREGYLKYLKNAPELSESDRKKFIDIISTVKLVNPGKGLDASDMECNTIEVNASYSPVTHSISLCAGLFNSAPHIELVFAHELSHALGLDRFMIERLRNSELNKRMGVVIDQMCGSAHQTSCTPEMKKFLGDLDPKKSDHLLMKEFQRTPTPLGKYRECMISDRENLRPMFDQDGHETEAYKKAIQDAASEDLVDQLRSFASNEEDRNPCDSTVNASDPNRFAGDELSVHATAYAAYLCENLKAMPPERAQKAIEKTVKIYSELYSYMYRQDGPISDQKRILAARFSDNTEERFADGMGDNVFAQMVKDKYPDDTPNFLANRRKFVAANQIMLCSNGSGINEMNQAASGDAHPSDAQRILDFMSPGMREVLRCKKDFENKECRLEQQK